MRILWFVPICLPAMSFQLGISQDEGGWWIESLLNVLRLNPAIELGVVWSSRDIHEVQHFIHEGINYYCLPEGAKWLKWIGKLRRLYDICGFNKTESLLFECIKIISDFKPDVIHIHGSEKPYGLIGNLVDVPVILSIQGILTEYTKVYFGDLVLRRRANPELLYGYLNMSRRAKLELQAFQACKYFAGRTIWDQHQQKILNPEGIYYSCGELLRSEFYKTDWILNQATSHTIYTTTSCLPYKGIDTLFGAVVLLIPKFPNICLRIGGNIPNKGYGGILHQKVRSLRIEDHVIFLGWLSAEKIANELAHAHLFVIPSFIENSPNSLAEAQLVGTPVVASSAGGIPSMVMNEETGLLFPPGDVAVLALQITRLFDNVDLALKYSEQGRRSAIVRHDEMTVVQSYINAYHEISLSTGIASLQ